MDRGIIYPGQVPLETDLLYAQRAGMVALSKLAAAILGTTTLVNGLAVTQTGVASMNVQVAAGEIYQVANLDGTAYSSLSADTTHSIVKQGVNLDATLLPLTAPGTAGFSINYLIQAALSEADGTPVVLPYYNASNPGTAYSGPGGTGSAQNTRRTATVTLSAKAGTAAATGTQTTPSPDAGFVGLAVVTVANGASTVVSGNISAYGSAPYITETLTQKLSQTAGDVRYAQKSGVQQAAYSVAAAGGTANALTGSFSPAITALSNGMTLTVRAGTANTTTTPTFTPNSGTLAAKTIVKGNNLPLLAGDIAGAGHWITLQYDSTLDAWVIQNPAAGVSGSLLPKAVVVFQGATGTILKNSGGVSSVTRNATGDWTINFNAGVLADANYGATFGCDTGSTASTTVIQGKLSGTKTTSAYQITAWVNTATPTATDPVTVTVVIYD